MCLLLRISVTSDAVQACAATHKQSVFLRLPGYIFILAFGLCQEMLHHVISISIIVTRHSQERFLPHVEGIPSLKN